MTDELTLAHKVIDAHRETMLETITTALDDFESATGLEVRKLRRDEHGVRCLIVVPQTEAVEESAAPVVDPARICPRCFHSRSHFNSALGRCQKYEIPEAKLDRYGRPEMCGCDCPPNTAELRSGGGNA